VGQQNGAQRGGGGPLSTTNHGLVGRVDCLEVFNGTLLAGGPFSSNGNGTGTIAGLSSWNDSMGVWDEFGGGVWFAVSPDEIPGRVHDITVFTQSGVNYLLVIGGEPGAFGGPGTQFSAVGRGAGRIAAANIAIWNGSTWQTASSGLPGITSGRVKYNRCTTRPTSMGNSVPLLLVKNDDTSGLPCLPSS